MPLRQREAMGLRRFELSQLSTIISTCHHKVGHLFQGRYKAIMIEADDYLLELAAYIHLNPVRSHLADRPEKFRWSSHRAFIGKESLPWLETGFILSQFSSSPKRARSLFADFVNRRIEQGRIKEFHGEKNPDSRIFGDEFFVNEVLHETEHDLLEKPDLDAVIAAIQKVYGQEALGLLRARSGDRSSCELRALAAWATMELSGATLTGLAALCGRDVATLSYAARRAPILGKKDPAVFGKMRQLEEELSTVAHGEPSIVK